MGQEEGSLSPYSLSSSSPHPASSPLGKRTKPRQLPRPPPQLPAQEVSPEPRGHSLATPHPHPSCWLHSGPTQTLQPRQELCAERGIYSERQSLLRVSMASTRCIPLAPAMPCLGIYCKEISRNSPDNLASRGSSKLGYKNEKLETS